jgi:hypothetical protein
MAGGEYVQGFNSPVIIADCSTGSVGEEIWLRTTILNRLLGDQ